MRIAIDTSLKSRLAGIFADRRVVCAYLFGSQAKRTAGPLSDIDIAVYLDEAVARDEYFDLRLEILGELIDLFKTDNIDLVVLNDAPPLLAHRVLKEGQLLFSSDERRRVELEVRTVLEYLDWKPYVERYTREALGAETDHGPYQQGRRRHDPRAHPGQNHRVGGERAQHV